MFVNKGESHEKGTGDRTVRARLLPVLGERRLRRVRVRVLPGCRNLQGEILASGQTDNEGQASWSLRLPASQSELLLESGALPPLRLELAPHPRFK